MHPDQFVIGIKSHDLGKRLLSFNELSLEKATQIRVVHESSTDNVESLKSLKRISRSPLNYYLSIVASLVNALYVHTCVVQGVGLYLCLLYTSPSPRDLSTSRMPSSA